MPGTVPAERASPRLPWLVWPEAVRGDGRLPPVLLAGGGRCEAGLAEVALVRGPAFCRRALAHRSVTGPPQGCARTWGASWVPQELGGGGQIGAVPLGLGGGRAERLTGHYYPAQGRRINGCGGWWVWVACECVWWWCGAPYKESDPCLLLGAPPCALLHASVRPWPRTQQPLAACCWEGPLSVLLCFAGVLWLSPPTITVHTPLVPIYRQHSQ